jgi:hypothetical protein
MIRKLSLIQKSQEAYICSDRSNYQNNTLAFCVPKNSTMNLGGLE